MLSLPKLAVVLTVALSVVAMPSHIARNHHNRREVAARVAHPESAPVVQVAARDMSVPAKRSNRRKRDGNGRCNPGSSSVLPPSTEDSKPTKTPEEPSTSKEDPKPTETPSQEQNTPKEDPKPTTSSTKQADPQPTPSPTKDDPKETPTPSPTPDTNSGGGQTYTGQGTFYATGLGACGITNNDGQDIAAVSHLFFDTFSGYNGVNPNNNPLCNKTAKVTYKGKTIYVQLTDRCAACAYGDLDFSPNAFNQLADPAEGRISGISWQIVS